MGVSEMSSEDWKNKIKKESKKSRSFSGLNPQWQNLGLISKKIEVPKPKEFPCPDCACSFAFKASLENHRRFIHKHKYKKSAPKQIKKRDKQEQKKSTEGYIKEKTSTNSPKPMEILKSDGDASDCESSSESEEYSEEENSEEEDSEEEDSE